jgi:hypothetical protein
MVSQIFHAIWQHITIRELAQGRRDRQAQTGGHLTLSVVLDVVMLHKSLANALPHPSPLPKAEHYPQIFRFVCTITVIRLRERAFVETACK